MEPLDSFRPRLFSERVQYLTEATGEPEDAINNQSDAEQTVDYSEVIESEVLAGEIPFETILEGIDRQFDDYVMMEDRTNYVDLFYNRIHESYNTISADEEEEHPQEIKAALDKMHQRFVDHMVELFKMRLMISIMEVEDETIDMDEVEAHLRQLYEFFILGAENNFKLAIAKDLGPRIANIKDDRLFFQTVHEMMDHYSPLIRAIEPDQFLEYIGNMQIIELFKSGRVTGNFLRKYSPRLYKHEEFEVELINYITLRRQVREELRTAQS